MVQEIAFAPTDVDVISTKIRTWNLKHPGNVFYNDLVQKMLSEVQNFEQTEYKRVAEKIVDIVRVERGGRFLKLKDRDMNPTTCKLMDRKLCILKVAHALRTAQAKKATPLPAVTRKNVVATKVKKGKGKVKLHRKQQIKATSQSPRLRHSCTANGDSVIYMAKQGNQPINKYALDLISLVCNQYDCSTAHRVLDKSIRDDGPAYESDKERLMRLQLRQRFAAAVAIGMSPVEFSRKLLKIWGGNLVMKRRETSKKSQSQRPPPTESQTEAFFVQETVREIKLERESAFSWQTAPVEESSERILLESSKAKHPANGVPKGESGSPQHSRPQEDTNDTVSHNNTH